MFGFVLITTQMRIANKIVINARLSTWFRNSASIWASYKDRIVNAIDLICGEHLLFAGPNQNMSF